MTMRLKMLLALLLAIAALAVFDRPAQVAVPEISEGPARVQRTAAVAPAQALFADTEPDDALVPDLFALNAEASAPEEALEPPVKPARPFTLLGFKREDGVREAYLLRNGDVLKVRAGAVLEQRYRVLALTDDAVDIKDNVSGAALRIGFEDHP
ncbi:hypothetical protein [Massilia horti]|uniref:Type II secretion system protein GspC N-terminal domain-containing protein n=1 Tax=Massilia horti TaxID=2562153 RepID=A0A4Y9T5Q2_9BURK|nr:hypothetical protein [Massilia horti]TFW36186.1 hypothetical protein E4O92_00330 [Massilia horti]